MRRLFLRRTVMTSHLRQILNQGLHKNKGAGHPNNSQNWIPRFGANSKTPNTCMLERKKYMQKYLKSGAEGKVRVKGLLQNGTSLSDNMWMDAKTLVRNLTSTPTRLCDRFDAESLRSDILSESMRNGSYSIYFLVGTSFQSTWKLPK